MELSIMDVVKSDLEADLVLRPKVQFLKAQRLVFVDLQIYFEITKQNNLTKFKHSLSISHILRRPIQEKFRFFVEEDSRD
ncbi:hypothetical protein HYC85_020138 [Camellia sinensis]|uniref:Uncharacterized protein n=1 Tax=Camellia sinensis TaxID=4442 RepID=A0A7J7GSL4_CAMSI|nr:hypothetical protein HYC85_020138 [Camellia sinensis]